MDKKTDDLHSADARLLSLLNHAGDAVFVGDSRGRIVYANDCACESLGYTREEMTNLRAWDFEMQVDPEAIKKIGARITAGEKAVAVEGIHRRKDGSTFPVEVRLGSTWFGNDKHVIFIARDISKNKEVEKGFRERETQLRAILTYAEDGIVTINEQGIMASFNPAAEKMFGYEAADMIGRNVSVLMPEPHASEHDGYLARYLRTGIGKLIGAGPREVPARKKDGTVFPLEIAISKMVVDDKTFFIGILRNITERKRTEEELLRYRGHLEDIVRSRTARLETALKEKAILVKEIDHRAKNNLQVIASLIKMQSANIQQPEILDKLRDLGNRINAMGIIHHHIFQADDLSRIDVRGYLARLAQNILQSFSQTAGVELIVNADGMYLDVETCTHCGLMASELITNCLKYAFPPGKNGKIEVSLCRASGNIELIVRDDGVGMQRNIDIRDTRSLGMQIVTALAEDQLEGKIKLSVNGGTEFKIVFPERPAPKNRRTSG